MISAKQMYRNAAAVHLFIGFKGMLKMKKAISVLFLALFLCGCDPYVNVEPSSYENSVWVCENPHIIYTSDGTAKATVNDEEIVFRLDFRSSRCGGTKDIQQGNEIVKNIQVFTGACKYSKTKFIIKVDTETDNLFDGQYDELVFVRQEDEQTD